MFFLRFRKKILDSCQALCYTISAKHTPRFGLVPVPYAGLPRKYSAAAAKAW